MRRFLCGGLIAIELAILTALILLPRFANCRDVFVNRNVYFTDADCYARMTRVRLCAAHPGLIIRHHDFENYPAGTTPHTTAPFDYLILGLACCLKPFSNDVDMAGALISPVLALAGGWFFWWWSRRMRFRYRWIGLVLYAISPILVHGTELGRPDHQSALILLVMVGVCAEWSARKEPSMGWGVFSAAAWALAIWVSAYEPALLFLILIITSAVLNRSFLFGQERKAGWIVFGCILLIALLVERRLPSISIYSSALFLNWSRAIGELHPVTLSNPIWFRWAGYLLVIVPFLIWQSWRRRGASPIFILILLAASFGLTIWQARWGYFFLTILVVVLPALLETTGSRSGAIWIAFSLSLFPIFREWDDRIWPNDPALALQMEHRIESVQIRGLARTIQSPEIRAFLAPWWLSPEIAYWSGQPGVGGSSHEALPGIADTARFYITGDPGEARELLQKHRVEWVIGYDAARVTVNSAGILGLTEIPSRPLGEILDRTPAQAPAFLVLAGQNPAAKLFRVVNNR